MAKSKKATRKKTAGAAKTASKAAQKSPAKRAAAKPAAPKRAAVAGLKLTTASPSLTVGDLQKSIAWYCDVMGFVVKERWENNGTLLGVELAAGPVSFMIGQDDWKKGRDRIKGVGFRIYCTTTNDVDELAARIKSKGGTLAHEPRDEWGMRAISVTDPDGFHITISAKLKG